VGLDGTNRVKHAAEIQGKELTELMAVTPDGPPTVLAQRLAHLFKTVHPRGRGPYTQREAADKINELAGEVVISHQYLGLLCSGKRTEVSPRRLQAIADMFGVDVAYFTSDEVARRTDEELEILRLMRDQGVRSLAFRAEGLSPSSLKAILTIVEQTRIAEGLPPAIQDEAGDEDRQ